jgi:hypothetical protein
MRFVQKAEEGETTNDIFVFLTINPGAAKAKTGELNLDRTLGPRSA